METKCDYCNFEYDVCTGRLIEFCNTVGPKGEQFESYMFYDCDSECYVLHITSDRFSISIEIEYCPICGRKLN